MTRLALAFLVLLLASSAALAASDTELAVSTADTAWDLVAQHGPIWGAMLAAFGLGSSFVRRNETEHWISQGRTLAIVVGVLGVLGSVLEAGIGGGAWAGVIVTAIAALKLALNPTTSAAPKAGAIAVSLLLIVAVAGCDRTKTALGNVAGATIDCMAPDAASAIAAFAPAIADVLRNATAPDGRVDWTPVRAVAAPLKTAAQRCVLASVISEALRPSTPHADEPQASALQWDPVSLAAGFETVRAEWGGQKFRLETRTL